MMKRPKLSRREFAATAGFVATAVPALAQSPKQHPPQDDDRQAAAAAESRRRAIAQLDLPIETEPAFIFKA